MDKKKRKQKCILEGHKDFEIDVPIGKSEKKKKKNRRDNEDVTTNRQELKKKTTDVAEDELSSKESKDKERKRDKKRIKRDECDDIDNKLDQDVPYNVDKVINDLEGKDELPKSEKKKEKKNKMRYNEDVTTNGQELKKEATDGAKGELASEESKVKERKRDKKRIKRDMLHNVGNVTNWSEGKDELPKSMEAKEVDEKNSNSSVGAQRKEMDENNSHSSVKTQRKKKDKKKFTLDPSEVDAKDGELKVTNKDGIYDKKRNKSKKKHRDDEKSALLVSESHVKGSCSGRSKTFGDKDLAKSEKFRGSDDKMIKKKKGKDGCDSEFKDTNNTCVDDKNRMKKERKHRLDEKPAPSVLESPAEGSNGRNKPFDKSDLTKGEGFTGSDDKMVRKKEKKKKRKDGDSGFEVETINKSELCSDSKKKLKRKNDIDDSATAREKQKKKKKKRVSFSGAVEVFPLNGDSENEEADDSENEKSEEQLIYGKRFTPKEDQKVRDAIDEYIEKHELGEEGIQMILKCREYPQIKNCWKEIGACLPYRPRQAIYYRAHCLLERSELRKWTPEEYDELRSFYKRHGADWRTLADKLGKHRFHVKDAWRRVKSPNFKKGNWSQDEYQGLFDLVNLDLRMKVNDEKDSKHGMLRDNIHWEAISDKLTTRYNAACCVKWYKQLTSPLVSEGLWADVDDYMLIDELIKTDACCIEDVDWDHLLEHRSGEICRRRWDQMTRHLGSNRDKPFIEQLQVLSKRYCPEMVEYRK